MTDYTQQLAGFLAGLRYQDLPPAVLARMEELFLDWLGSALAGKGQHPIPLFERYAERMGPADGSAQILPSRRRSSPYFAALVNGAASHVVEQDDLHNSSVLHPAAVVFPAALAAAQDLGRSGAELILAAVAGYEAGIRIGEFLGRSHYRVFHTTATVGTLAAAVAVGKLMDFDRERFVDLLGSAGTQAAGLWEFLRDAADSKQLHTAKAAADGLLAAYLTADGLSGARHILEGEQGMAAGMSSDADPERLVDRLGSRWALLETSFKFHASCRHTHPAADALLALMQREGLDHSQIAAVTARVHQGAIDVLGRVVEPQTVHQAKFSHGHRAGPDRRVRQGRPRRVPSACAERPAGRSVPRAGRDAPGPGCRCRLSAALARAGRSTRSPGAAPYRRHRRTQGRSRQYPQPRRTGRQVPPPAGVLRRGHRRRGGNPHPARLGPASGAFRNAADLINRTSRTSSSTDEGRESDP